MTFLLMLEHTCICSLIYEIFTEKLAPLFIVVYCVNVIENTKTLQSKQVMIILLSLFLYL